MRVLRRRENLGLLSWGPEARVITSQLPRHLRARRIASATRWITEAHMHGNDGK